MYATVHTEKHDEPTMVYRVETNNMVQTEKVIAILVKCRRGHYFKTDFHTADTNTFKEFIMQRRRATCSSCGISVNVRVENTTYVTARGRFGRWVEQEEAVDSFTYLVGKM